MRAFTLRANGRRSRQKYPPAPPSVSQEVQGKLFHASDPLGWSIEVVIPGLLPNPALATFLLLSDAQKRSWLEGKFAGEEGARSVEFSLHTDFSDKPLLVTMPLQGHRTQAEARPRAALFRLPARPVLRRRSRRSGVAHGAGVHRRRRQSLRQQRQQPTYQSGEPR